MFYFGYASLLFTFPVGGVGNGLHKLRLAVSLFLFVLFYFQFISVAVLLAALMEIGFSSKSRHVSENLSAGLP